MPMLRTIERPTYPTLRLCLTAASRICCTRCTWEAKQATMIRWSLFWKTVSSTGPMDFSEVVKPGHLGVGGVGEEQVDALLAEPGERTQVGDPAVERELVHLEVAGVQHQRGAGADRDGERVGDRVVDGDELELEGAERQPVAGLHLVVDRSP